MLPHFVLFDSISTRHPGIPSFLRFCESASNLQRLAASFPDIEEEKWAKEEGFLAWLDCLRKIRTLRSLELLVVPDCIAIRGCTCQFRDDDESDWEEYWSHNALVDSIFRRAADRVFQTLGPDCPAFGALQFRARDEYCEHPHYCCAFVRSTLCGHLCQTTYEAVPIELHTLKEYDSYSGIYQLAKERITTDAKTAAWGSCEDSSR